MTFYYYTGGHIALCSIFLYHYCTKKIGLNADHYNHIALFCGTWLAYSWVQLPVLHTKIIDNFFLDASKKRRDFFLTHQLQLKFFFYLLIFINLIFWSQIKIKTLLECSHLLILVLCYQVPIKNFSLRDIPFFKTFLISYIWAALMTIFAVNSAERPQSFFNLKNVSLFLEIFFFINSLTVLFDLRDKEIDTRLSLQTFATIKNGKIVKYASFVFFCFSIIFEQIAPNSNHHISIFRSPIFYLSYLFILFFENEKRSDFYYLFFIDSLIIMKSLSALV